MVGESKASQGQRLDVGSRLGSLQPHFSERCGAGQWVAVWLDRTPSFPVRSVSAPAPHQQLLGMCPLVIAFTQATRAEDTRLPTRSWIPACTCPQGRSGGVTASLRPLALRPVQCSLPRARVPQLTCRRCLVEGGVRASDRRGAVCAQTPSGSRRTPGVASAPH